MLECVPDDKLDYQPHPKSMNMARLATHVAELPSWTTFTLDQDVLDMQPGFQPHFAKSRAELLEMFDKAVAEARPKIESATDQHWNQIWTFKFAGKTLMSMPRSASDAQRDHESPSSSSRAVERLSPAQRCGDSRNVRPVGR